jgi:hypothetical protein
MAKHAKPGDLRRRVQGLDFSGLNVLVVDEGLVFVVGRLRPVQKVDSFGDDLAAVAIDPGCVGPLGVVDAATHEKLHPFFAILLDRLAEAVEAGDAVPFGVLNAKAVLVAEDPTFGIARAGGGEGEVGDRGAALGGAGLGGLADVTSEDDDVLHDVVFVASSEGTVPPMRPVKDRWTRPARTSSASA